MQKLCLVIIDGFGVAPPGPGNARTLANLPTIHRLEQSVPNVIMEAAGNAAGLPEGQQGASEPGHLIIGAGRIVWQPLEEINQAIASGAFFQNAVLKSACDRAKKKGMIHLIGMYSVGGVHSLAAHMHAMIRLAKEHGVPRILLHLIGDGRDVGKQQLCEDLQLLQKECGSDPAVKVASIIGRYYAMDRDQQYKDRTKVAYDLYTSGKGESCADACAAAQAWYKKASENQATDYYISPHKTADFEPMREDDTVICVNFRSDRTQQIIRTLADEDFTDFQRTVVLRDVVCMGPYSSHLPVAFPAPVIKNTLGEVVSKAGLKQLRIAESDKFPHVTFFFNAQRHEPFKGEERIKIESPKVANFADAPDMSADKLADTLIEQIQSGAFSFIVANFANPDLVGHGAKVDAAIKACEAVDRNLGRLLPVLEKKGYAWIVTADHGNAEDMLTESGDTNPSHTANPVQTFVHADGVDSSADLQEVKGIKDIAPLCLKILGLRIPAEMQ